MNDSLAEVSIDDEETAFSISSPSLPVSPTARRYRCGAALASIFILFAIAATLLSDGIVVSTAKEEEQPPQQDQDTQKYDIDIVTTPNPTNNNHFYEAPPVDTSSYPNPLPSGPADMSLWSSLPVKSTEEHTLGYPFVAACVTVDEATRPIANHMAGEFDILEAFPNHHDENDNDNDDKKMDFVSDLFTDTTSPKMKKKTWTYTFLIHDEQDLAYFLSFGMDYVPDLLLTRDMQDSRIGISHEDEEYSDVDSPGRRRRLARPACDDGTCRKSCAECSGVDHNDSQGNPCCSGGGGGGGGGTQCPVVNQIDYNSMFTAGLTGSYEGINQYSCYRTVSGTNATVDDLLIAYPNLTEKVMLDGYPTYENGFYLYVLVLTNKQFTPNQEYGDKGKLLATSSIHSREFTPAETMMRFAEYLLQNYDKNPDVRWVLDWNELHLILHANPDGRKYDEVAKDSWRKNRRDLCSGTYGTDLNRNFPYKWNDPQCNGCSSSTCTSNTYRGDAMASEQETKAIWDYAQTIFPNGQGQRQGDGSLEAAELAGSTNTPFPENNTGIFMDVHSSGEWVGYPWGHKDPDQSGNVDGLGAIARKAASYNQYNIWHLAGGYSVDGDTLDTLYGWAGVAAFFWELGTSFYQSCTSFPEVINDAFPGLMYAAKLAKTPFLDALGPDVLCITLSAPGALEGEQIVATVEVSDSARVEHANDDGTLFPTGGQNIALVELYVDCHPNEGPTCIATTVQVSSTGTTASVDIPFIAPASAVDEHAIYIRAQDSDGYHGAVTAESFVTCPSTGCPFTTSPTKFPTKFPTNTPTPDPLSGPGPSVCDNSCTGCSSNFDCKGQQGCEWKGTCRPLNPFR